MTGLCPTELLRIAHKNIEPKGQRQPPKNAQENRRAGTAAAMCGLAQSHKPAPVPALRNNTSVMSLCGKSLK